MSLPEMKSYNRDKTDKNRSLMLSIGETDLYFSYQTLVAFRHPGAGLVVRQNDWGVTTGKHLNWSDQGNKEGRVSEERFKELYEQHVEHNINSVT
jgi:hypothetical protein